MNCCQCQGIEEVFDSKTATKDLKRYQKKGPAKSTRFLLNWLKQRGETGLTLLDVGGGVGIIQHELLQAGVVETAVHVDAASPYLQTSRNEARRLGHADRVTYHFGNFVDLAEEIGTADIVTLDRVLCCYHDMPALVNAAAGQSKKYIGLVFPRDVMVLKWAVQLVNLIYRLSKNPFRIFIHSTKEIEAHLNQLGFQRIVHKVYFFWQSMVYVKSEAY
jgi:magnesium-protoporphyrin O-methyltransferase